jgi:hypothetical protein
MAPDPANQFRRCAEAGWLARIIRNPSGPHTSWPAGEDYHRQQVGREALVGANVVVRWST